MIVYESWTNWVTVWMCIDIVKVIMKRKLCTSYNRVIRNCRHRNPSANHSDVWFFGHILSKAICTLSLFCFCWTIYSAKNEIQLYFIASYLHNCADCVMDSDSEWDIVEPSSTFNRVRYIHLHASIRGKYMNLFMPPEAKR